jgi:hypothetical protein
MESVYGEGFTMGTMAAAVNPAEEIMYSYIGFNRAVKKELTGETVLSIMGKTVFVYNCG